MVTADAIATQLDNTAHPANPIYVSYPTGTAAAPFTGGTCGDGDRPVVFLVHGWLANSNTLYEGIIDHFTRSGNIVVMVTYGSGDLGNVAGSAAIVLAIIPGMPVIPLLVFGAVLILASRRTTAAQKAELQSAVSAVCHDLAQQMVRDAEGASKDIAVEVVGAASVENALEAARAVGRSNLLKCALHGQDPNWGRVLAAVGTTSAAFAPEDLDVSINGVEVCRAGGVGEDRSLVDLSARDVRIRVDLHAGTETATVWTNDLTHDYVHENSAYST